MSRISVLDCMYYITIGINGNFKEKNLMLDFINRKKYYLDVELI